MADPKDLQDQIFDMVKRSQEAIIDAGRNFADGASELVPGDKEQIDKLIDNAFDLTQKILTTQRDFAKRIVETVTAPVSGRSSAEE